MKIIVRNAAESLIAHVEHRRKIRTIDEPGNQTQLLTLQMQLFQVAGNFPKKMFSQNSW